MCWLMCAGMYVGLYVLVCYKCVGMCLVYVGMLDCGLLYVLVCVIWSLCAGICVGVGMCVGMCFGLYVYVSRGIDVGVYGGGGRRWSSSPHSLSLR